MTKTKKKTTKAVTLLTRIGTLLSDVIDDCSGIEKSVEKNAKEPGKSARVRDQLLFADRLGAMTTSAAASVNLSPDKVCIPPRPWSGPHSGRIASPLRRS
jgi:hypothetical protein